MGIHAIIAALTQGGTDTPPPDDNSLDNAIIVCFGDSKTQGDSATPYPTQLAALSPFASNGATVYRKGQNGRTLTQMIIDAPTEVYPLFVSGVRNICIVWEFTNQLGSGTVPAQDAVDEMHTLCDMLTGQGFEVIVCTDNFWNGANPAFDLVVGEANDILRDTYTDFADGVADLQADEGLDPYAHPDHFLDNSGTYYHPNTVGYAIAAGIVKNAILALQ